MIYTLKLLLRSSHITIMKQIHKLTVISRRDLSPGYQAVQSGHALADYIFEFPIEANDWHRHSNFLIYLSTENEASLKNLLQELQGIGVAVTSFREPDINDELTAIAFVSTDETRKLTSGLPLQLKNVNK